MELDDKNKKNEREKKKTKVKFPDQEDIITSRSAQG